MTTTTTAAQRGAVVTTTLAALVPWGHREDLAGEKERLADLASTFDSFDIWATPPARDLGDGTYECLTSAKVLAKALKAHGPECVIDVRSLPLTATEAAHLALAESSQKWDRSAWENLCWLRSALRAISAETDLGRPATPTAENGGGAVSGYIYTGKKVETFRNVKAADLAAMTKAKGSFSFSAETLAALPLVPFTLRPVQRMLSWSAAVDSTKLRKVTMAALRGKDTKAIVAFVADSRKAKAGTGATRKVAATPNAKAPTEKEAEATKAFNAVTKAATKFPKRDRKRVLTADLVAGNLASMTSTRADLVALNERTDATVAHWATLVEEAEKVATLAKVGLAKATAHREASLAEAIKVEEARLAAEAAAKAA